MRDLEIGKVDDVSSSLSRSAVCRAVVAISLVFICGVALMNLDFGTEFMMIRLSPTPTLAPTPVPTIPTEDEATGITAPVQLSSVKCSHGGGLLNDRVCEFSNFCLSEFGVLPQFDVANLPDNLDDISPQLSTYTAEGKPLYWRPQLAQCNNPEGALSRQKVLIIYAPTAWANKVPVHLLLNNMIPLFRALENAEPNRRYQYPGKGNVWRYKVDVLALTGGFATDWPALNERSLRYLDMLGVDFAMSAEPLKIRNTTNLTVPMGYQNMLIVSTNTTVEPLAMLSNTSWCYERVHAGVGGAAAHWDYARPYHSKFGDETLWKKFRESMFLYGNGCEMPGPVSGIRQRDLVAPQLIVIQRGEKDVNTNYGRRIIDNMEEMETIFFKLRDAGAISFQGHVVFSDSVSLQKQMCIIGQASIVVGIHGNSLSLTALMEPGCFVIELGPIVSDFYTRLSSAVGLHHSTIVSTNDSMPDLPEVERAVRLAVDGWRRVFRAHEVEQTLASFD